MKPLVKVVSNLKELIVTILKVNLETIWNNLVSTKSLMTTLLLKQRG